MSNTHVRTLSGLSEKATLTSLFTDVLFFRVWAPLTGRPEAQRSRATTGSP